MWTEKPLEELADKLVLARGEEPQSKDGCPEVIGSWGRAIFLVGAGCSASAGIPVASQVAKDCALYLARAYETHDRANGAAATTIANAEDALAWLIANRRLQERLREGKADWGAYYTDLFDGHLTSVNRQREFFDDIIRKAGDKLNWAHICLGELISRRYVHTVLTTNFDQLVLQGVIRTGLLPVIADGIESLNRVTAEPKTPQIVHLHGSMHTYDPRNGREAIMATQRDPTLRSMLYTLLHRCDVLVVVGYAGGEECVMELLRAAARQLPPLVIYWVLRDQSSSLSPGAEALMSIGENKFVIRSDADALFKGLFTRLKIGEPEWMKNPVATLTMQAAKITRPDASATPGADLDIIRAVDRYTSSVRQIEAAHVTTGVEDELDALLLAGHYTQVLGNLEGIVDKPIEARLQQIRAVANYALVQEDAARDQAQGAGGDDRLESVITDLGELVAAPSDDASRVELHRQLLEALMLKFERSESKEALDALIARAGDVADLYANSPDAGLSNRMLVAQAHQQRGEHALSEDAAEALVDLQKARQVFTEVLGGLGMKRADRRWAECKAGLATTLQTLGEKEAEEENTKKDALEKLNDAVTHHRDLLLMNFAARSPDQAGRLYNLATTMRRRAEIDPELRGTLYEAKAHLEQAITIYKAHGIMAGAEVDQAQAELVAVSNALPH